MADLLVYDCGCVEECRCAFFCDGCGETHAPGRCWVPFRSDEFWCGAAALGGVVAMGQAIHDRIETEAWEAFEAEERRAEEERERKRNESLRRERENARWSR